MRSLACGLVLVTSLVAATARAGGGWVPARGESYVEASVLYSATDEVYDATGQRRPFLRISDLERPTTFRDASFVVFGEYGVGHGWGVGGNVAWKQVEVEEPASRFQSRGPADLRLGLKRGFHVGSLAWALSADASVPLGYAVGDYPARGSGEVDVAAHVHAGHGFSGGWTQAELGVRHRGGAASDEWPFALQAGLLVRPKWTALVDLRGHGRLGVKDGATAESNFDPALAGSSVVLGGPAIVFRPTPRLHLSVQALRSFAGRSMPAGWKWKLAVARSR